MSKQQHTLPTVAEIQARHAVIRELLINWIDTPIGTPFPVTQDQVNHLQHDRAALLALVNALVAALEKAMDALHEAEAILGGEYGDHYGVLCQYMLDLRIAADAALSKAKGAA